MRSDGDPFGPSQEGPSGSPSSPGGPGDSGDPAGLAAERIRARIAAQGRISVADFMAEALYGPGGFYRRARDPIGPRGHFYTSARLHPAFAALLAVQIAQVWDTWARPGRFDVCEVGGGRGTLATDLGYALHDFSPALATAVHYVVVDWAGPSQGEGHPPARDDAFGPRRTFARLDATAGVPRHFGGVVLANELLDALPTHRIQKRGGQLHELCVVVENDRFVERPFPIEDRRLAAFVAPWQEAMPEGTVAEAQLQLFDWIEDLGRAVERGIAILIDYADEREALWKRRNGSLRGYRHHRIESDPFADPGELDITYHVDLATLRQAASRSGLEVLGEISQAAFLDNLGMAAIREAIAAAPLDPAARQANLAALADLVSPTGLGAFRVVILGKGVEGFALVGRVGGGRPAAAPVLTHRHMSLW